MSTGELNAQIEKRSIPDSLFTLFQARMPTCGTGQFDPMHQLLHNKILGLDSAEYQLYQGFISESNGELYKALKSYRSAENFLPFLKENEFKTRCAVHLALGELYLKLAYLDSATLQCFKLLDLNKKHELSHDLVGCIHTLDAKIKYEKKLIIEAKKACELALEHFKRSELVLPESIGKVHFVLGYIYVLLNQREKADSVFDYSLTNMKERCKAQPIYPRTISRLGRVKSKLGRYDKALELTTQADSIFRHSGHQVQSYAYFKLLINLGMTYFDIQDFNQCEIYFTKALNLSETLFGNNHPHYGNINNLLGTLYSQLTNHKKSELHYNIYRDIEASWYGTKTYNYAVSSLNLGNVFLWTEQIDQAGKYYKEAFDLFSSFDPRGYEYAISGNNLSMFYEKIEDHSRALVLCKKMTDFLVKQELNYDRYYLYCLTNLGRLYRKNGMLDSSEIMLNEAHDLTIKLEDQYSEDYLGLIKEMAYLYIDLQQHKKATLLLTQCLKTFREKLINSTRHLTQEEVLNYENRFLESLDYLIFAASDIQDISSELVNSSILLKGFLLDIQYESHQGEDLPDELKSLKDSLYQSRIEHMADLLNTDNKDSLLLKKTKIENLEKTYIRAFSAMSHSEIPQDWKYYRDELEPRELIIDINKHYVYNEDRKTDTVCYTLTFLKKQYSKPLTLPFYKMHANDTTLSSLKNIYNDCSQSLFWHLNSAFDTLFQDVDQINVIPSDVFGFINFNVLPVFWRNECITLGEHFEVHQYLSWRMLKNQSLKKPETALLIGNIDFGILNLSKDSMYQNRSDLYRDWKQLPESKSELDSISIILRNKNIKTTVLEKKRGTEAQFISQASSLNNPNIIHLATHGYYYNDPNDDTTDYLSDYPMLRSGLIFAKTDEHWKTQKKDLQNDGVRTALEISQMNLLNTELLVLSACETALGDIRGVEGIFGLQRAFKIAGVKNIIMSLWEVPDYQTKELMIQFYKNWITKGMSISSALQSAQYALRDQGYEPYYWAGWVLLE